MGCVADNAHDPAEQKFLRRFFKSGRFLFLPYILSKDRNLSQSVTAALNTSCSTCAMLA
jgi:hypothetical protein